MAKATAISFSFTPHIHSGTPSSQDGGVLLLSLLCYPYLYPSFRSKNRYKLRYAFTFYFLISRFFIYFFHPRHIGTVFDKVHMYNVVKERKTKENHNI